MNIGIFTDSYLPSPDGVATSVESTARELQKLGHTVYIIAPNQPHHKDRKRVYRLASVRIVKTPEIWWGLEVPQPALFKIAALEFDIIHGHSGGPVSFLGWQLARLHSIPFVETYHTLWKYYRHYFLYPHFVKLWMIKKLTALTGNDCDAMITPSLKAKNELLRNGVKKPIYVVPNGLVVERYANNKPGFLHERYNLPKESRILLTVGRLHKEKAIDFLIKAFAQTKTDVQSTLVIVGIGPGKDDLQSLAANLGISNHVLFIGSIPHAEMPYVYADSDVFLFASQTETQGMVVLEALASGVPVIAVEDDAFAGVIENNKNGYLVKKDVELYADKLRSVLQDSQLRTKLSKEATLSAEAFTVGFTTRILEQIYQEIIFTYTAKKQTVKKHHGDFADLSELWEHFKKKTSENS